MPRDDLLHLFATSSSKGKERRRDLPFYYPANTGCCYTRFRILVCCFPFQTPAFSSPAKQPCAPSLSSIDTNLYPYTLSLEHTHCIAFGVFLRLSLSLSLLRSLFFVFLLVNCHHILAENCASSCLSSMPAHAEESQNTTLRVY